MSPIIRFPWISCAIFLFLGPVWAQSQQPRQQSLHQYTQQTQREKEKSNSQNDNSPGTLTPPPLIPPKDLKQATENSDSHAKNSPYAKWWEIAKNPVDVFTGIIAFFTLLLVGAGFYQVAVARAATRRQLRAYVFVHSIDVLNVMPPPVDVAPPDQTNTYRSDLGPMAYIVIKNSGQTPGGSVFHGANIHFAEFPLASILPYSVEDPPNEPQWTQTIPPGGQTSKTIVIKHPLSQEQVAQLWANTHAIYVYGGIAYRDAFGMRRITKYRFFLNGMTGFRYTASPMASYESGNEAN